MQLLSFWLYFPLKEALVKTRSTRRNDSCFTSCEMFFKFQCSPIRAYSFIKVFQDTTRCDAECFLPTRQLSITTDALKFACGINKCYQLNNRTYDFTIAYPDFKYDSEILPVISRKISFKII